MRYLGLDLGTKTLGISISDLTKTISSTYKTINYNGSYDELIEPLREIITKESVSKLILGLPINMNYTMGDKASNALEFKKILEENLNIEVIMQDERLSTVEAHSYLIKADVSRKKRKKVVDKIAANIILQSYLDKKKG